MKLITAIMRPEKLDELIDVVVGSGAHGLTVTEVRGFGQQFGQLVATRGTRALLAQAGPLIAGRPPSPPIQAGTERLAHEHLTSASGRGPIWFAAHNQPSSST
jgi:hypothetical protein